MSTEQEQTSDRRNFYRITDSISIDYQILEKGSETPDETALLAEIPKGLQLINELRQIDADSALTLRTIEDNNRDIGNYLKSINKKIELVAKIFIQDTFLENHKIHEVSVSAGGLNFDIEEKLDMEQLIRLEVFLPPDYCGIICYAKVVKRQPSEINEGHFNTSFEYTQIREVDRDTMVRHVMARQSAKLRYEKEQIE